MYHIENDWYESVGYEIVVSKAGSCRALLNVGQLFIIDDYTTPEGMCLEAFHNMYPILFAGMINGNFSQLGSKEDDILIFNCPSSETQFLIQRFYQCNNCGNRVNIQELNHIVKDFEYFSVDAHICKECSE